MPMLWALSDLHVDYPENLDFVKTLSNTEFKQDGLVLAGDISDSLELLEQVFRILKKKFKEIFYVPGNHELWIRPKEACRNSFNKFKKILNICDRLKVHTKPAKFQISAEEHVWLVPLFSWYAKPEDDLTDSLYMAIPVIKEDTRKAEAMWMDNQMCKWPSLKEGQTRSTFFAEMNEEVISREYDGPVITYSHMVPRREIMQVSAADRLAVNEERKKRGLGKAPAFLGDASGFNFTRYAGSNIIEKQLRRVGAVMHIYGHQHRNRDRVINGVHYISHCLGNVKEQNEGFMWGLKDWKGPKIIWPQQKNPYEVIVEKEAEMQENETGKEKSVENGTVEKDSEENCAKKRSHSESEDPSYELEHGHVHGNCCCTKMIKTDN